MMIEYTKQFAKRLDELDSLKKYRKKFHLPKEGKKKKIYLNGNSLGLQPKSVKKYIRKELKKWKKLGVEGHFDESQKPWFYFHKYTKKPLAKLLNAKPEEVVAMNSLTVNLHLLLVSFYNPTVKKHKIIIESNAFPSDRYALESHIKFHGFDPKKSLIELSPKEGESTLKTEDILKQIYTHGDELSMVMMSGVNYYTGQFFDLKSITKATHSVNAISGFDLAHAIGNVPLSLHDWNIDFAAWCSYKYLNSGPGGVGGIYIHEKYAKDNSLKRFEGWWGFKEETRFEMKNTFVPMYGADAWQISNTNVLSMAAHMASLNLFQKVGMKLLRSKSIKLTNYLERLLQSFSKEQLEIITPKNADERGAQLSIIIKENAPNIFNKLKTNQIEIGRASCRERV